MSIILNGTTGITSTGITETSDGNVGVGVTPNAWGGSYKALQTTGPSMWGSSVVGHWTLNNYFDGSNYRYIADGAATDYYQLSGAHFWRTAPDGTAGNTISFSQKVRIDSDGLKFNGDTAAANALDDYEEGTWTPVLNNFTQTGTNTPSGIYTKIGRAVYFRCFVDVGGTIASSINTSTISGLPFSVSESQVCTQGGQGSWATTSKGAVLIYTDQKLYLESFSAQDDNIIVSGFYFTA